MDEPRSNRKPIIIAAVVAALAVAAVLAFGVFGVHTLFIDKTVDEALPEFSNSPAAASPAPETANANDDENDDNDNDAATTPAEAPSTTSSPSSSDAPAPEPTSPATEPPAISTVAQGSFSGADSSHDVSGQALVLTDGSSQRVLRFEDFEATNGPDLKVYLRAADGEFVSLGNLKGNIGNQNYEIPADVDLSVYSEVQIWCQRFSVNFGSAILA